MTESTAPLPATSTDIEARVQALAAATDAATGRVDDGLVAQAREVVDRAGSRLRLSAAHTVVGIAGATGSGKSSTFNALTGLELSAVGVRRPTTSWATACVWGSDGAAELLEWLGIPDRHQTTRDSMLDTRREGNELDGVVLLDLPDHDSTEVAHHLEVDRLVSLADLLIWVVDPQKYADAAIHDRYLEPLKTHSDVMVVVLNHIDEVPEDKRDGMVADLKRLLVADGLPEVPVLPVAARLGWGVPELRALIAAKVADKKMTTGRLAADVRAVAGRLDAASGSKAPATLPPARIEALDGALADAAGISAIVDAVGRSTRLRVARAAGWPPVAWVSAFRADPLKSLKLPQATGVQRSAVDAAARSLADDAGAGLGPSWQQSISTAATARLPEAEERIGTTLSGADLGVSGLPGWVTALRVVQWLLIVVAVGCGAWVAVRASAGTLGALKKIAGLPFPAAIGIAALVVGIVLAVVARLFVAPAARARTTAVEQRLRASVASVGRELVVAPVEAELAAHAATKEGLATALRA